MSQSIEHEPQGKAEGGASGSWIWGPWSMTALITAIAVACVDQVNKWWMLYVYDIADKGRIEVLPFLDFVFVLNRGISYGLFTQSDAAGQYMLAGFAIAVSIALMVWLARASTGLVMAISIGSIVGGAVGNAIDRVLLGGVADFYSLHAFGFYWYVFNIADVAIVVGVVGLLYDGFWGERQRERAGQV